MYLNRLEKEALCRQIHQTLTKRGGYWITADIYFRYQIEETKQPDDSFDEFLDQHRAFENMFIDETDARQFFESMGFKIDRIPEPDFKSLNSYTQFMNLLTKEQLASMDKVPKLRETWQLGVL